MVESLMGYSKFFIFLSIGFFGCSKNETNNEFQFPQIINSQLLENDTSILFEADSISGVYPAFIGKFKFDELIDINPSKSNSKLNGDFIFEKKFLDLTDSIDANGFELEVDYHKEIPYNRYFEIDPVYYTHYPVYFINSTKSDKLFLGKDSWAYGIQEASTKKGGWRWQAIEHKGFDFCGNGKWGIVVHPNEFVLVLVKKYKGDFETSLRVRFQVGQNIYVSLPFEGKINKKQFDVPDSSYIGKIINDNDPREISWFLMGAETK